MADEAQAPPKKKSKKGLVAGVVILILGVGAGGGYFLTSKSDSASKVPATTTTTEFAKIVRLEPFTTNLTDGRVAKVGLAMAVIGEPKSEHIKALLLPEAEVNAKSPLGGEESEALDIAIKVVGSKTYDELSAIDGREHAKEEIKKEVVEAYHGDVVDVYFTTFVMS
jgi:flagellar FliL protein